MRCVCKRLQSENPFGSKPPQLRPWMSWRRSVVKATVAISASGKAKLWAKSLEIFSTLQRGKEDDEVAFNATLAAVAHAAQWRLALHILQAHQRWASQLFAQNAAPRKSRIEKKNRYFLTRCLNCKRERERICMKLQVHVLNLIK